MKKTEIALGGIVLAGIILRTLNLPGNGIIIVLSMTILAMMYYLLGFAVFNNIELRGIFQKVSYKKTTALEIILAVFAGIIIASLAMGILFNLQSYPGRELMLLTGLIATGLVLLISLVSYLVSGSGFSKRVLSRAVVFVFAGLVVQFLMP